MVKIKNRRYIGNKNKLLNDIFETVETNIENKNYTFADLFAGTGVVSYYFAEKGHKVFINDILFSNYIIYKAWFGNEKIEKAKIEKAISEFNEIDCRKLNENYFSQIYGDKYYLNDVAKKIGYIRDLIEQNKNHFNNREYAILITSLLYAADKAANTVGHFEHYLKSQPRNNHLVLEMLDAKILPSAEIFNTDANILAKQIKADVVYIDPPYNARQYVNFYHVLENLARWEKPTEFEGTSMKFKRNHLKSGYSQAKAPDLFADLIKSLTCNLIVVSYNNTYSANSTASNNKITEKQLKDILSTKGIVSCKEIDYNFFNAGKTHFKNHKEMIFVCRVTKEA
jgi:adenine-specific DNA-methyltransferase